MYLSYYHLNIEPFSISTDPKFLWLGEKHKEALAALEYGILANKGFLLLTGDVGTGKTTLINALVNNLASEIIVATIHDPGLEKLDFLNYIAGAFKLKKHFRSKGEFLSYFSLFLKMSYDKNKKVLLIVDEAQRLNDDLLEEIRLLSNIEEQHTKLINIFFVGQNEFNEILKKNENRALRQRITLIHSLETLNKNETQEYIKYRLKVAGASENIFKLNAIEEIYSFSGGYPRLINIICDHALLTGFVKEKKTIDAQIIKECANELRIPIKSYEKENTEGPPPAAGPNSEEITANRPARFTIRTFFLLTLLLMAAAVFYYQSGVDLPAVSIKKYWRQFVDAPPAPKTESSPPVEQISEPDNSLAAYRTTDLKPNRQETVILLPPPGSVTEKWIPDNPENNPVSEKSVQLPATGIQTDNEKKKPSDKTAKAGSLKINNQDIPPPVILTELPVKKTMPPPVQGEAVTAIKPAPTAAKAAPPVILAELPVKKIMPPPVQRETISEIRPETIVVKAEKRNVAELSFITDRKLVIYYQYNSNELSTESIEQLDRLAMTMVHDPAIKIDVKGYTDNSGWVVYNKKLSEFRAYVVKSYLVGKGVNPLNIETAGMGPDKSIEAKATPNSMENSRRAEIELHY